jgi:SAM-dependent methyltransferase
MTGMLFKFFRQPAIDPLQVSMTGVRMGERFLLVGCDDPVLLAGLGAKVGLSGLAAAVVFDEHQAVRARTAATREGFLIEQKIWREAPIGFDDASFDLAVVDDTKGSFAARDAALRGAVLSETRRALRPGGRVEVVEGLGSSGPFGKTTARPAGYDAVKELEAAGYRPVRVLAAVPNFRFVEGLRL